MRRVSMSRIMPNPDTVDVHPLGSAPEDSIIMPDTIDQSTLLSMLMGSQGGAQSGGLDLQSLLTAHGAGGEASGLSSGDPLQLVMRWLEQRRAAEASVPEEEPPSEAELELLRLEEMRQARQKREEIRELNRLIKEVCAERDSFVERFDTIAAALGACHLCFRDGLDLTCPVCGGQGRPGWRLPEPEAFREYIAPAVNRVRALTRKRHGGRTAHTGEASQTPE